MRSPVRQHLTCLLALGLIIAGAIAGLILPIPRSPWQPRSSDSITHGWNDLWIIASRNIRLGFQLLLGVASLGGYSLIQLFAVGLTLGLVVSGARHAGVPWSLLVSLLGPHTPFEFAGFAMLGALEFEAAIIVYHKLRYDRTNVDRIYLRHLMRRIIIGFLLITLAALVEVYITGPLAKHATNTGGINRKINP